MRWLLLLVLALTACAPEAKPALTCVPPCAEGQRCIPMESVPVQYRCLPAPPRCAVTLCGPGKHCVEGVGCVADPEVSR